MYAIRSYYDLELLLGADHRVLEGDREVVPEVRPPAGPFPPHPEDGSRPEEFVEQILDAPETEPSEIAEPLSYNFV